MKTLLNSNSLRGPRGLVLTLSLTYVLLGRKSLSAHDAPSVPAGHAPPLLPATILQLETVRQAASRFFDVQVALDEGYIDIEVVIPHMGRHLLKPQLLDAHFELTQPELLVYEPDCDGSLRLVAVEYAVPTSLASKPPQGFIGDSDIWFNDTGFKLWTLHAWVYDFNPAGVFEPFNPRLP